MTVFSGYLLILGSWEREYYGAPEGVQLRGCIYTTVECRPCPPFDISGDRFDAVHSLLLCSNCPLGLPASRSASREKTH